MKIKRNRKLNNRNRLRVIQITGLRGILSAGFVVVCLTAGFVGFPSIVLYKVWNIIASSTMNIPTINLFQGFILWGILAVSYIIINQKRKYLVAFEPKVMSSKDVREIINEIKAQSEDFSQLDNMQKNKDIYADKSKSDDTKKEEEKV